MAYEKDPNEIGALWQKEGRKGVYMTGTINGERVVVFRNGNKKSDKAPDWKVLKSQPREDGTGGGNVNEVGFVTTPSDEGIPF